MFCLPFLYLPNMICLKSFPLYIYVSVISLFFCSFASCQCYIKLMVWKFLDNQLWATSHLLLSDDGHVKRLQKQKEETQRQGVCKGEIWTALLEVREAGMQAGKLSDSKMAKRSWWVCVACTQAFSHREVWMHWTGFLISFYVWLKPLLCSKANSLPRRTLLAFPLSPKQHFIDSHQQRHKSTFCGLHSHYWDAIRFITRAVYLREVYMSMYKLLV